MNKQIKAGADIHAGDGGYSIGTQERYEEFARERNRIRRDTLEMVREAWAKAGEGWVDQNWYLDHEKAFKELEALVRADYSNKHAQLWLKRIDEAVKAEREACAKVCDDIDDSYWGCEVKASWCSKEIRARGETK
jgi:hypothetical protein